MKIANCKTELLAEAGISLTPRFSGVAPRLANHPTVSTVSSRWQTLETVAAAPASINTLLKQGVKGNRPSPRPPVHAGLGRFLLCALALLAAAMPLAAQTKPLYENNFQQAELDKLPDDFMLIDGGFAVKAEGGEKFLELPGAPLETYGVLFGPSEGSNIVVIARFFGTGKGRRYPTFAAGLNGIGGYKLQVSPGKGKLEIYRGETVAAAVPYAWKSGAWTFLKLQIRQAQEGVFKVEGKAWVQGEAEPKEWTIALEERNLSAPGRPSVWGCPYAGTPIRFDDLRLEAAESAKP